MQSSKINIRQTTVSMCEVAVCAALLCVLSPLSIPTPFGVGFTLQVLIVLLTALILKPLHALAAQVIYTLLGIVGLPVFSNYQSGFGVIAGPTGGFIIGFIFASFFVSLAKGKENGKWTPVRYLAASVVIGIPCIYLPGILFSALCLPRAEISAQRSCWSPRRLFRSISSNVWSPRCLHWASTKRWRR